MQIFETIAELRGFLREARCQGQSIGLVPTMGALHEGHLSLMRTAAAENDIVVASIFVNPTQFGPQEDLAAYPRNLEADARLAAQAGVTAVFHPSVEEMYKPGNATWVEVVGSLTESLCGRTRPGHFRGVTTVVSRLFNIIQPDRAYFGQKDAQQVQVLKRMTQDLCFDIQLRVLPIVRESDGLAMSSRNAYLSAAERQAALVLSRSLAEARRMVETGERDTAMLEATVAAFIRQEPLAVIDYVELVHPDDLKRRERLETISLLAIAVRIGKTRLIDNTLLEVPNVLNSI
ncbi:pantoate--beta-alanine ligase [Anaerosporomusa subterranea]|uniref:Pantothenate synthetase n=1 Tax=Anaerosporomusa subterranea TaxID=1794912 RepID=A0A154BPR0_ANASB|nr:pantoate--beta-alanine ligase [Anaerosporomusa subterranea]KYZ75889.1 pantoate--beta-alanine ligase [Anaerosporomusa subterranea]